MRLELLHTTKLRGGVSKPQGTLGLARMTGSAHLDFVAGTATLENRMEIVGWLTVRAYQGSK